MASSIRNILSIQCGEGKQLFWLILHSFFIGLVTIFFESSASALFLTKFGIKTLPYAYLAGAAIVTVFGIIYAKIVNIFTIKKIFAGNLTFLIITVIIFRISFYVSDSKWIVLVLFLWIEVIAIMMSLEFWGLAGLIFNVRQGKRLFSLIGTGEVMACILGGFMLPKIVNFTGTKNLLIFAAGSLLISLGILLFIEKTYSEKFDSQDEENEEDDGSMSLKEMLRNRYLILLFMLSAISVFGYYFADYAFYDQIGKRFTDENEIASYFGIFFAVSGITNLIFKLFISGKLLNRYGLKLGLTGLPVMLGIGAIIMTVTGSVPKMIALFFWFVSLTKLFDNVLRTSLEEPSMLILFQPLLPTSRLGAQAKIESIIEPVSGVIVSLLLIILGLSIENFQALHIAYMFIILAVIWAFVAVLVNREYPKMLEKALSKRTLSAMSISFDDNSSLEILKRGLESDRVGEVIYSMNMLEGLDYNKYDDILLDMIHHKNESIRYEVISRIEKRCIHKSLPILRSLLDRENSSKVKEILIITVCELAETEIFEEILPFLEVDDLAVKRGAMIGLLRNGGIEGVIAAGGLLTSLINSIEPANRIFAAEVLGNAGIKSFYRPLINLINDNSEEVCKAALEAAGNLKSDKLWTHVINCLDNGRISNTAMISLIKGSENTLDFLFDKFNNDTSSHIVQLKIVRILSGIKGEKVISFFEKNMDFPENNIRYEILSGLVKCKYKVVLNEKINYIKENIIKEIKNASINYITLMDIGKNNEHNLLRNSVEYQINKIKECVFNLLSYIYSQDSILKAKFNMLSESSDKKAYAIEIIDNFISLDLKDYIIPLFEDMPIEHKIQKLNSKFQIENMSKEDRLKYIINSSQNEFSAWIKTCALYISGKLGYKEFYDSTVHALTDINAIVRETAVWTLAKINPEDLIEKLQPLLKDKEKNVAEIARNVIET